MAKLIDPSTNTHHELPELQELANALSDIHESEPDTAGDEEISDPVWLPHALCVYVCVCVCVRVCVCACMCVCVPISLSLCLSASLSLCPSVSLPLCE